jgi:hypothetical protein
VPRHLQLRLLPGQALLARGPLLLLLHLHL